MPTPLRIPKSITLRYEGKDPLTLPGGKVLAPGETTLPLALWHSLGADPALVNLIASGAIRPVHRKHEFQEGDEHCIGCPATRAQAEAERKAALPPKAPAAP